jgi:hypothetical protein|tara:strand:- start:1579 stop:1809 length:231 start_codon:yes stop_codon:yes gene_type:complete
MKSNIPIELTDEQRLILGRKYHNTKAKKLITRKELGRLMRKFIEQVEVQSNTPDEIGIEEYTKAIAKMRWHIETED